MTSRVVARIPLGGAPGGSQYYQPQPHQLLRTQFHPITLPFFTVQLVGSDGEPYDSRDTPHTLSFELVQLSDPEPPPPEPPRVVKRPEDVSDGAQLDAPPTYVDTWLAQNKWNVLAATGGALGTLYLWMRLRAFVARATGPLGAGSIPGAVPAPRPGFVEPPVFHPTRY